MMMKLPKPLLLPIQILPDALHTFAFARLFNQLIKGQSLESRLQEIEGKSITIAVEDLGCAFRFVISGGQFKVCSQPQTSVTIKGSSEGFWSLATHQQDPDTLFFNRSLCIEGETETGVHIKNLLDAMEYDIDAHFDAVLPDTIALQVKKLRHQARHFGEDMMAMVR